MTSHMSSCYFRPTFGPFNIRVGEDGRRRLMLNRLAREEPMVVRRAGRSSRPPIGRAKSNIFLCTNPASACPRLGDIKWPVGSTGENLSCGLFYRAERAVSLAGSIEAVMILRDSYAAAREISTTSSEGDALALSRIPEQVLHARAGYMHQSLRGGI